MSDQRINSAVKLRPFQPQIGQRARHTNAVAVGQAQKLIERLKRRYDRFWLWLEKMPFQWLTRPTPLNQTVLRQFMIDVRQANHHESRQSVMSVQQWLQPISNKQTFKVFMTKYMQQVVRTAVSSAHLNLTQSFLRQNQTRLALTSRQYQEQRVSRQMQLRQAASSPQTERQMLIQRLWQQGRRVEQPHPRAASASTAAARTPLAALPMSVTHSQPRRTTQQNQPIPVQDEVIRVENGRFPAQSSAAKTAATFNVDELDGIQLQRLTDQIVRRIDDRIQAQRERLGRF